MTKFSEEISKYLARTAGVVVCAAAIGGVSYLAHKLIDRPAPPPDLRPRQVIELREERSPFRQYVTCGAAGVCTFEVVSAGKQEEWYLRGTHETSLLGTLEPFGDGIARVRPRYGAREYDVAMDAQRNVRWQAQVFAGEGQERQYEPGFRPHYKVEGSAVVPVGDYPYAVRDFPAGIPVNHPPGLHFIVDSEDARRKVQRGTLLAVDSSCALKQNCYTKRATYDLKTGQLWQE